MRKMWQHRPDDERVTSLQELHDVALQRAESSKVEVMPLRNLEVVGNHLGQDNDEILVNAPVSRLVDREMVATHWGFGQLCSQAEVYAPWAREKSHPEIVAAAINWGLQVRNADNSVKLMSRDGQLRCITGPDYGRIYDHELAEAITDVLPDSWGLVDAYTSDRDCFAFIISNDKNIEVRDAHGNLRNLYRGAFAWNSEVGKTSIGFKTFYFDSYCLNRTIFGMQGVNIIRLRHTKNAPLRLMREAMPMLEQYVNSSPQAESELFHRAAEMRVGRTQEDVEKWLQKRNFNKSTISQIISEGRRELAGQLPTTVLDLVNAGTSYAKTIPHTDNRVRYEEDVSRILKAAA